jgi:hypothetical protein
MKTVGALVILFVQFDMIADIQGFGETGRQRYCGVIV